MPLLDLAQRPVGVETNTQGWLPVPVIEFIAEQLGMPYIRAFEVATFYTMYNLAPVGRYRSEERRVGKACVVRVDLGGRRIIIKQTQQSSVKLQRKIIIK